MVHGVVGKAMTILCYHLMMTNNVCVKFFVFVLIICVVSVQLCHVKCCVVSQFLHVPKESVFSIILSSIFVLLMLGLTYFTSSSALDNIIHSTHTHTQNKIMWIKIELFIILKVI